MFRCVFVWNVWCISHYYCILGSCPVSVYSSANIKKNLILALFPLSLMTFQFFQNVFIFRIYGFGNISGYLNNFNVMCFCWGTLCRKRSIKTSQIIAVLCETIDRPIWNNAYNIHADLGFMELRGKVWNQCTRDDILFPPHVIRS